MDDIECFRVRSLLAQTELETIDAIVRVQVIHRPRYEKDSSESMLDEMMGHLSRPADIVDENRGVVLFRRGLADEYERYIPSFERDQEVMVEGLETGVSQYEGVDPVAVYQIVQRFARVSCFMRMV